jgi:hypothetical protein
MYQQINPCLLFGKNVSYIFFIYLKSVYKSLICITAFILFLSCRYVEGSIVSYG